MIAFEVYECAERVDGARYVNVTLYSGPSRRYRTNWQMRLEEWNFLLSLLKPSRRLEVTELERKQVVFGEPDAKTPPPPGRLVGPDRDF